MTAPAPIALPLRGSCQCGNIRYQITQAPLVSVICHCRDCQKLSASAYSTGIVVHQTGFRIEGELTRWERSSRTGRRNAAYFCPHCGNRIYHEDPEAPALKKVKAGTLDDAPIPAPQAHYWVMRKQPWVIISDEEITFDTQPESLAILLQAIQGRTRES